MSRLSEILGVPEYRKFKFGDWIYRINDGRREFKDKDGSWCFTSNEDTLCEMIAHPELIELIPEKPKLTEQQITAIKGRIAEGTPWAAEDKGNNVFIYFYADKPCLDEYGKFFVNVDIDGYTSAVHNFYNFITFENSPVYLPELIKESEK